MLISDRLITAPTGEPVTLAELKSHLRVTTDEEDGGLTLILSAAREYVEGQTGRALITQTRCATLNEFPPFGAAIVFGRVPLAGVVAVKYLDGDLEERTLSPSAYYVDTLGEPGSISLRPGQSWPAAGIAANAVRIEYTCGQAVESVSATLKQAVLFLAAHFFENGVPVNIGNIVNDIPFTLNALIWSNRVIS